MTETNVAFSQLQRERDLLRAVVDGLADPQITMAPVRDDDGKIIDFVYIDANPAALRYLGGLSRERFTGMRLRQMYPSDAARHLLEQYARTVDSGVPLMLDDYAYPNELFGGQERRYDLRGALVDDLLVLTWRDVTERHRMLRRLAESEYRYRMLAENAADLVIRIDAHSRIDWVSPSVKQLLGYEPEALVGSSRWDLLHPEDRSAIQESMAGLRSGRHRRQPGDQPLEARLRHRDGSYRWFSTTARPAGDDHAEAPVILGLRLIDSEVRARQAAEDQRTRREAVLETMLDPHVLMSAVRDQDGRIIDFAYVDANRAALEYLSLQRERLLGARLLSLFPAHAGTWLLGRYLRTVETGEPLAVDDVEVPNDVLGQPRRYDVRAVKVGDALSLTWRDVTQRHADALRLARSEEHYRLLAEHSGDVVWQVGQDAIIAWASPSTRSTLGHTREAVVGAAAADLLHRDDRARLLDVVQEVSGRGQSASVTARVLRGDGSYLWMEVAADRVPAADGLPAFLVLRLRDVDAEHAATEALTAEREQFRSAMDAASIGMCLVAPDGRFLRVNAALCDLLGRDAAMLATCTWQELTHPEDLDVDLGLFADVLNGWREGYRRRKRYLRPDGTIVWGDLSVSCVRERDRQVRHLIAQIVDVTTEQQQERALRAAREQYRLLAENATDIVLRTNTEGVITYCSQGVTRVLGWTPAQVLGRRTFDLVHPDDQPSTSSRRPEQDLTGHNADDLRTRPSRIRVKTTIGVYRWMEASFRTIRDDDGRPVGQAGAWRDVDAEVRAQQELRRQATTDTLTGLLNRAEIVARLNSILSHPPRTGSRIAVAFADLDHLKEVNDEYGHTAGDALLQQAAERIKSSVREGDLVARIGGDELLIVLHGVRGLADATAVADKIREALAHPHTTPEGTVLTSTASIGLTLALPGEAVDHLINRADHAMYEAKRHGGNSVFTSDERVGGDVREPWAASP